MLYIGQQQEDELHCYVFDIAPKKIEGKKRYFQGRIWVDDHDFQIVKTYGKTVPDIVPKRGEQGEICSPSSPLGGSRSMGNTGFRSIPRPTMSCTSRWKTYTLQEIVKYEDYKRFGSNVEDSVPRERDSQGRAEDGSEQAGSDET